MGAALRQLARSLGACQALGEAGGALWGRCASPMAPPPRAPPHPHSSRHQVELWERHRGVLRGAAGAADPGQPPDQARTPNPRLPLQWRPRLVTPGPGAPPRQPGHAAPPLAEGSPGPPGFACGFACLLHVPESWAAGAEALPAGCTRAPFPGVPAALAPSRSPTLSNSGPPQPGG